MNPPTADQVHDMIALASSFCPQELLRMMLWDAPRERQIYDSSIARVDVRSARCNRTVESGGGRASLELIIEGPMHNKLFSVRFGEVQSLSLAPFGGLGNIHWLEWAIASDGDRICRIIYTTHGATTEIAFLGNVEFVEQSQTRTGAE
jgi:hypothetical protein